MSRVNSKEKIRLAALELFRTEGFRKTTIARIESAAGLAPRAGTFYRHFESKEALLFDLAVGFLSETPEQFGLESLSLMSNTRAELIAIALKYEEAGERQKPYTRLFDEIRALDFGSKAEDEINSDMMAGLMAWVAGKPAAEGATSVKLAALTLNIFGPWLFFQTKALQGVTIKQLDRDAFLDEWAGFWSAQLDRPAEAPGPTP
jgi:AcrR family transcriptional regulator